MKSSSVEMCDESVAFTFKMAVMFITYYLSKMLDYNCSDGYTATGLYIAASFCFEKMMRESQVDVYQAVEAIKSVRPQFVHNAVSLHFKFWCIKIEIPGETN